MSSEPLAPRAVARVPQEKYCVKDWSGVAQPTCRGALQLDSQPLMLHGHLLRFELGARVYSGLQRC